jgi:predicted nucleic acid-binding protein
VTHLDTSFIVDLLREATRHEAGPATRKLDELANEELAISMHVACELHAGAELSRNPAQERERVSKLLSTISVAYPDERFPTRYGELLAELQRRGEPVSTMDLLIATSAVLEDAAILTRNVRDFERVPGLHVRSYRA